MTFALTKCAQLPITSGFKIFLALLPDLENAQKVHGRQFAISLVQCMSPSRTWASFSGAFGTGSRTLKQGRIIGRSVWYQSLEVEEIAKGTFKHKSNCVAHSSSASAI
jgi:hypothetical protein